MKQPWPLVPLGEVLRKSEERVELRPDEEYREVTVKLWGKGVVERRRVSGSEIAAPERALVRQQQFILSRIDARNGAFGLVPESLDGAVVSNDFPSFDLSAERVVPAFLGWLSKTHDFIEICKHASEGTTNRVRLKEDRFLSTEIPLPPLPEQRRIVARIEALAGNIEEARALRQQAAEETLALGRSAAAAEFSIRAGVQRRPIRDLVSVVGGGTPSKSNPFFWGGDIPWVTPKDMKVREITGATDRITPEAVKGSAAKLIEPGAVLVVVRGMILAHTFPSAILRVPGTINQDMKALRANGSVTPEYLCNALWALNRDLLGCVEKSTHDTRKFETDKLLGFELPVPPLSEQRRIVAYLDGLQAKVDALKQLQSETAAELDALLPAILDKAFKGDL